MEAVELKKTKSFKKVRPTVKFQEERPKSVRANSLRSVEDLVQCGICLDKFKDPRMLPCQHSFCLGCLETHLIAKNLIITSPKTATRPMLDELKSAIALEATFIRCPLCQLEIKLPNGYESLDDLPKNLYINSLLQLLEGSKTPTTPKLSLDYKCVKCQTVSSDSEEHVCQHCLQVYCSVCWTAHLKELDDNLAMMIGQIVESEDKLKHKMEDFSTRCDRLNETISETMRQKIKHIESMEKKVKDEVETMRGENRGRYEDISGRVEKLKSNIEENIGASSTSKIITYMNMHRETAKLFDEIYHFGEARVIFDPVKFTLDQDEEGIYNEIDENEQSKDTTTIQDNQFENIDAMVKHYRTRSFVPKLIWNKCPRPGGVGIAPWDPSKIYITATDNHNVLILNRDKLKFVGRINHKEMLCPISLAFSVSSKEILISDKWKHCVHIFSDRGEYKRSLYLNLKNPEGITLGPNNELIICDTGHNRLVLVDLQTSQPISVIGSDNLSLPSSVTVFGKSIIVADTGNHRIKVFSIAGDMLMEFGSMGRQKGQFRSAEVVAVDCWGFIFVGDAGNARIQVFRPDGKLVKIIGSKTGFSWVSGIHVTPELDIITTDSKSRCLRIY